MLGFAGIVQSGNRGMPPLLDTYSGAAAAYSLRKLRTAYTGSAVRVRRIDDSVESDIGFDNNGNLNETALMDHVGYQNLFTYSEQFDNAVWSKYQSSVNSNTTTDPIGGSTADSIIENTINDLHRISVANISITSGFYYTFSVYVKKANLDYVQLAASNPSPFPSGSGAIFNISTGAVDSTGSGTTASIINAGNGWYRCIITMLASSTTTASFFINPYISSSSGSYIGTNGRANIHIWGAQLVSQQNVQPYRQTTSSVWLGVGYVTKWYDQSGNALDAVQTTAANQPRIVNAGVVEKEGGRPTIVYDGLNDYLSIPSSTSIFKFLHDGTKSSVILIGKNINNGSVTAYISNNRLSSIFIGYALYSVATNAIINRITRGVDSYFVVNNASSNGALPTSQFLLFNNVDSGNSTAANRSLIYLNGGSAIANNTDTNAVSSSNATNDLSFMGLPLDNLYYSGKQTELIFYNTDKSSVRTAIESNINTYYSIY